MFTSLPLTHRHTGQTLGQDFSVVRIICIGRNYTEHAREMGHDPEREPPMFFFKPITALAAAGAFVLPGYSNEVDHELELVVAIGQGGSKLSSAQAAQSVCGFALGLDMTCRDTQRAAKKAGAPWELAKGFDGSAPCTPLVSGGLEMLEDFGSMSLTRNGTVVQQGHWVDMVWPVAELIGRVSQFVALVPGDLIFTGTPAGVGPVIAGDKLLAQMQGFPHRLELSVVASN